VQLVRCSLHAYCLPYSRPVKWSDTVEEGATFVMLRLESDMGHVGVAEMTTKPTWTGFGPQSLTTAMTEVVLPLLGLVDDLNDEAAVVRCLDAIPGLHAPKALVDNAVCDLRAAARGQALWRAWGGGSRVPVSYTVTRRSPEAMAREAALMVESHGFGVLKIKGGQGAEVDAAALRQLGRAVGDGVAFYVDANGAYPAEVALDYAQAMTDAGALVVDDPCPLHPNAAFRALQSRLERPILVDFNCWGLHDQALFLDAGARAFSVKPGRLGLSTARAMQRAARLRGATTVTGLFGESALGTWQALALASCAAADDLPAEVDVPRIERVAIVLPDVPSVAERVDWERVRRFEAVPAIHVNF
jgi:L-Ala-D/L-Glu epimerase